MSSSNNPHLLHTICPSTDANGDIWKQMFARINTCPRCHRQTFYLLAYYGGAKNFIPHPHLGCRCVPDSFKPPPEHTREYYYKCVKCWSCDREEKRCRIKRMHFRPFNDWGYACLDCGYCFDGSEGHKWRGPYRVGEFQNDNLKEIEEIPEVDLEELLLGVKRNNERLEREWWKCGLCGGTFKKEEELGVHKESCEGRFEGRARRCVKLQF